MISSAVTAELAVDELPVDELPVDELGTREPFAGGPLRAFPG